MQETRWADDVLPVVLMGLGCLYNVGVISFYDDVGVIDVFWNDCMESGTSTFLMLYLYRLSDRGSIDPYSYN